MLLLEGVVSMRVADHGLCILETIYSGFYLCSFMTSVNSSELTTVRTRAQIPSHPTLTLNLVAKCGASLHLYFCSFEADFLIINPSYCAFVHTVEQTRCGFLSDDTKQTRIL